MHKAVVLWTQFCVDRGAFIPYEEWRKFTLPLDTLRAIQEYEAPPPSWPSRDHTMSALEMAFWTAYERHTREIVRYSSDRVEEMIELDRLMESTLRSVGVDVLRRPDGSIAWQDH